MKRRFRRVLKDECDEHRYEDCAVFSEMDGAGCSLDLDFWTGRTVRVA